MRTYAEIDLTRVMENVRVIASRLPKGTALYGAMKADAYGHGAVAVARAAKKAGLQGCCVASAEEGEELIASGIGLPVLLLGRLLPEDEERAVELGLEFNVFDPGQVARVDGIAGRLQKKARVHAKLDTGMHRLGMDSDEDVSAMIAALKAAPNVTLEGVFSHLSSADDERAYTLMQKGKFDHWVKMFRDAGFTFRTHLQNTPGIFNYGERGYDIARPGIGIYGYGYGFDTSKLRPALSWYARVLQVRELAAGETVSYNRTFRAERPMTLACIAAGYADGYKRCLSSRGEVLLAGRRCRVVGRVCMDLTLVDVTGVPVAPGDWATLLGTDGGETIDATELAELCGTINYEILTSIHDKRVPRKYVGGEA